MNEILKSAFKTAKRGMDRTHSLMLKFTHEPQLDRWLQAKKVFNRHYRIASYIRERNQRG